MMRTAGSEHTFCKYVLGEKSTIISYMYVNVKINKQLGLSELLWTVKNSVAR